MTRAELTYAEKAALGRLVGTYTTGGKALALAPSDPDRAVFDALTQRGGWVEKTSEGGYRITNYGMSAFYTGKLTKGGARHEGEGRAR